MQVLKVGVPDSKCSNPLLFRKKLWNLSSLPAVGCYMVVGIFWCDWVLTSPIHLKVDLFLFIRCIGIAQFKVFLGESCAIHSYRFSESVGGDEYTVFLYNHLKPEPYCHTLNLASFPCFVTTFVPFPLKQVPFVLWVLRLKPLELHYSDNLPKCSWLCKLRHSLLPSPVWSLPICLDSWA